MTAQIGDVFKYKGKKYIIAANSEPINFNPEDYEIYPMATSTACWRGYWCEYNVSESGLVLDVLHVSSFIYPIINGISPEEDEFDATYRALNIKIPFTGKLLVGDGLVRYIHMGFQYPWAYRELLELNFEEGRLTSERDLSALAEQVRKDPEITKSIGKTYNDNLFEYINDCFSLDYKEKAWWLGE